MPKKRPPNAEATEFRAGEQQVEIARQGGVASGIARREKKSLREAMQVLMDADLTGKAADASDRYKQMETEL